MRKILFILLVILIGGGAAYYLFFLPIEEVSCLQGESSCSQPVLDSLKEVNRKGLMRTYRSLSEKLNAQERVIEYKLTYTFPNHIHVDSIERQPAVAMRVLGSDTATLFEADGRVIGNGDGNGLPVIEFQEKIVYGPESLSFLVQLIHSLDRAFGLNTAAVVNGGLVVRIPEGNTFIYPLEGDIDLLLGATRLVLGELNRVSENSTMKTIDFRYKNPVLK